MLVLVIEKRRGVQLIRCCSEISHARPLAVNQAFIVRTESMFQILIAIAITLTAQHKTCVAKFSSITNTSVSVMGLGTRRGDGE